MAKRNRKRRQSKPLIKRPKPRVTLHTKGNHHDLLEIYNAVNRQYFNGKIKARISWGRRPCFPPRDHKKFNMGRCHVADRLIIIHRALDRSSVLRLIVEYTVFHEMLHIKYPPRQKNGRQYSHYAEFRAAEKKFADYVTAEQWEKDNTHITYFF